ncbi:putative Mg2+ transporter-C (MgtC) family protein [Rhodococcus sp. LBL1]|nr:putative Mg2+ transporter-C (MgtC) family protein [Rhodococcus sp. LBL1]MDH6682873.1 putative Mg2+ transporter-C (MgtC) family protein [Rhodococcus sp. LBL2]
MEPVDSLWWGQTSGQGWAQFVALGYALVLCSAIGLEREFRRKSAGIRTYAIVGLGSALFVLISKFGFGDVLEPGRVVLDPSRVAAQIVTGIGFIGAGIIFVRRDAVRGLTTASAVWISAAVGAACGAGLPGLAAAVTVAYFVVVYAYPPLLRRVPGSRVRREPIRLRYIDGRGLLRQILRTATEMNYAVTHVDTSRSEHDGTVRLTMDVEGRGGLAGLADRLSSIDGVVEVTAGRRDEVDETDEFDEYDE